MASTWRDVLEALERRGFVLLRTGKGSHAVYRHPETGVRVVLVMGRLNETVAAGTLASVRRQAGISKDELP